MNLGKLIDDFRKDEMDDGNPPFNSDQRLTNLFNEAEEEAAIRSNLLRKTLDFQLVAGDFEIDLPPEITEIRTARIVEDGQTYHLDPTDRYEQDRLYRDWRDATARPTAFIHDDKSLTLNRIAETASVLYLECYRLPENKMADDSDEPEIAATHHRKLSGWVRFRAYSTPDADFGDKTKAAQGLADFEDYFGHRPRADNRRANNANRPHRVKAWI